MAHTGTGRRFAAPWDVTLKVTTVAVLALLVVLPAVLVQMVGLGAAWGFLLPLAIIVPTLALAPRGFAVDADGLVVRRWYGEVRIPYADVLGAAVLASDAPLRGAIRYFGVGGLFGYYGAFWSPGLGSFRAYLTRREGLVVVDTRARRIVLSPAAPEEVVAALRAAKEARHEPLAVPAVKSARETRSQAAYVAALTGVVLLIGLGAGGFGAYAAWHAHGEAPRAVYVVGDVVHIDRVDAPPVLVPLADVRGATVVPPSDAVHFRRVNGYADGARGFGHYQSPGLGDFTYYGCHPTEPVRLDTAGGPIVVTPDDTDAFLAAVNVVRAR